MLQMDWRDTEGQNQVRRNACSCSYACCHHQSQAPSFLWCQFCRTRGTHLQLMEQEERPRRRPSPMRPSISVCQHPELIAIGRSYTIASLRIYQGFLKKAVPHHRDGKHVEQRDARRSNRTLHRSRSGRTSTSTKQFSHRYSLFMLDAAYGHKYG